MIQIPSSRIICLFLMLVVLANGGDSNQQILSLRYITSQRFPLEDTYQLIKQLNLEHEVSVQNQQCNQEVKCQTLQFMNREGEMVKVINLPASKARVKGLVLKHIQEERLQIEDKQENTKNIQFLSHPISAVRLHSQLEKMKQETKLPYIHDWQKAHVIKENKLIQAKLIKKAESKKTEQPKQQTSLQAEEAPIDSKSEDIKEDYFKWYMLYLILILGLLTGMWYMHQHEKLQEQQHFRVRNRPGQPVSEETEKLSSSQ